MLEEAIFLDPFLPLSYSLLLIIKKRKKNSNTMRVIIESRKTLQAGCRGSVITCAHSDGLFKPSHIGDPLTVPRRSTRKIPVVDKCRLSKG